MITLSTIPTKAQAEAIKCAGKACCVQHPRAGNRRARAHLIRQLTAKGLPRRVALTLSWTTEGAPLPERAPLEVEPVQAPEVSGDSEASQDSD